MDDSLFEASGHLRVSDPQVARVVAARLDEGRSSESHPQERCTAGGVYSAGLLHELMHRLLDRYRETVSEDVLEKALEKLDGEIGRPVIEKISALFVCAFPPQSVFLGEVEAEEWLRQEATTSRREKTVEEILLVELAHRNPALRPYREIFDDSDLRADPAYRSTMKAIERVFSEVDGIGGEGQSLWDVLEEPMRVSPGSLRGQLGFVLRQWKSIVGPVTGWVLTGLDMMAEENKPGFLPGPGPVKPPDYSVLDPEYEAYSADRDWMPSVVMLAKNAFVWLAQLSARFDRPISQLNDIPGEVLDELAEQGFSALWLIGVWERSHASERIKHAMGDADAEASAYALRDYAIAEKLGGDKAWDELAERAYRRGIRMATDMVPNHVGIDGRWVVEHPDWFIGLDSSPFPTYTFSGPDLSDDDRVGIFLEDHYYTKSDAAVVFRRVDRWTGSERFIYHGNDGTSMPWNDTAQLDYLRADVREAVIQTILHVARRSPIIRFDAAMTLAKKHFHRLWYPEPGHGGDIPSRAGAGMSRSDLDEVMPKEFWREVVDRVAEEAPDTLLLAEAFWLLEGYFVRTLGMHRVYNSAFMNMLRDESNDQYRQLIKSTLEFDPQILKRYVNFMSNPDEETAVEQFGDGDKYFAALTLMMTLPGLPMFGHGQIEGLAEKYGMEFRRPRWEEQPNEGLIARHAHQVFPLTHRRWQFAEVDRFYLFDFVRDDGSVDENVFAYSNWVGDQRSLVIVHNSSAETSGWIRLSTAVAEKGPDEGQTLSRRILSEVLELSSNEGAFVILNEVATGLQYLRGCLDVADQGLFAVLGPYRVQVFVDIRQISDHEDGRWTRLCEELGGRGVPDLERSLNILLLEPVLRPIRGLISAERVSRLLGITGSLPAEESEALQSAVKKAVVSISDHFGAKVHEPSFHDRVEQRLSLVRERLVPPADEGKPAEELAEDRLRVSELDITLMFWALLRPVISNVGSPEKGDAKGTLFDELDLCPVIVETAVGLGIDESSSLRLAELVRIAIWFESSLEAVNKDGLAPFVEELLNDSQAAGLLGVNRHEGRLWFNRESAIELSEMMIAIISLELEADTPCTEGALLKSHVEIFQEAVLGSEYRVDELLCRLKKG
ncbi:MAG: alpha-amylase [bacterium]|nr:alpha-amylase [bacterium]